MGGLGAVSFEVAATVTVPPEGTADGAVYVVAAPLAVVVGLNDPQAPEGAQLQVTPALAESLATLAASEALAPALREVGGAFVPAGKLTAIAGGGGGGCVVPPELPPPHA